MKGKIVFVAGVTVGYVLGARAGRERYEQIRAITGRFWNAPVTQRQVHRAEDYVKDKAPEVVDLVAKTTKKVVSRSSGRKTGVSAPRTPPRTRAKKPAADE